MPNLPPRPPRKTIDQRRADLLARHPKLAAPRTAATVPTARPIDLITLGVDDAGRTVKIDDTPRMEHMHAIGATGCGKSTFLLNGILQDIARGRGVCVLDPHGGHPDSLINMVLRFLHDHRWLASRKVHIIAPNVKEHVVGFNPLAPLPGTADAVIADAMLKAFERAWGDENTLEKPTTRRMLRAIFTTLVERRLTIPDAYYLINYEDRPGVRRRVISVLRDEYARNEIERIERLARQSRSQELFEQTVVGPENRFAEFVSCDAIRTMLSMTREQATPDRTIDLLDIMNRGDILLIDLQHGTQVSEAATDLLGKLILRYLFLLIAHRKPYQLPGGEPKFHPFYVYVDECHRYVTDDIESLLTQARKFRIGVALAHQYLAQLGKPGDKIYEAVRNSTEIRAVFRIKSANEAQELAHDVVPLDLEMPVKASIRPVQVGTTIGRLANDSYAVHEGEGESEAVHASEAISRGRTAMQNWMHAVGHAHSVSSGSGTGTAAAVGTVQGLNTVQGHVESMAFSYDPATRSFIGTPMPLGMNVGRADSSATALLSSSSFQSVESANQFTGVTDTESESDAVGGGLAFSETISQTTGTTSTRSKNRGTTEGSGTSEALFPVYQDLPTSFHSKENVLYMAGETIRNLPIGRCIVKFRGNVTMLTVPPPRKSKP